MSMTNTQRLKVLMISSSGGHWVQMNRVASAFAQEDLIFCCTERSYQQTNPALPFYFIPDASRSAGALKLLCQAWLVFRLLVKVKPDLVVSTGASIGFFAFFFAKKLGKKTIWLDSIANVDQISLSGEKAKKYADLYLTQWEHLAGPDGPTYMGAII